MTIDVNTVTVWPKVQVVIPLALDAALRGLPPANSLIDASARRHGAELRTQDKHFDGLPGVRYFPKT